ncbi:HAD family hydrolase [Streptomyces sp. NPDC006510]|uniref:HAD family hydrolase n=1 Tax=Streptomyces sp. NPDC006510 TaxID=3155600 RepID=UPI0033BC98F5
MSMSALRGELSGVQHVLLDFDGPVCHVFAALPAPLVARELNKLYQERTGAAFPWHVSSHGDPLEVVQAAGQNDDPHLRMLVDALTAAEVRAVETAELTPGALQAIAACQRSGRTVSIVSNNGEEAVRRFLQRHGVADLVAPIIGRSSDVALMKPDPFPVRQALQQLGARPEEAVLVGDSPSDVQAAIGAGVRPVGYANKDGKRARLANAGATAVISSMGDLAEALTDG